MTQYRIDYVPDVPMTDIEGSPAYNPIGIRNGQLVFELDDNGNKIVRVASQLKFMLGRLSEPKFVEKLESMEAVCLVVETRQELKGQEEDARKRGYWLLDENVLKRLRAATEEPRTKEQIDQKLVVYDLAHAHNFLPFMQAIVNARKVERNAAEKLEEPPADQPS